MTEQCRCWCGKDLEIGRGQPTPAAVSGQPVWVCPEHGIGYTWRARPEALAAEIARLKDELRVANVSAARMAPLLAQVFLTVQAVRDDEGSDSVVYWAPSLGEEIGTALALEHGRVAQIASHEARQRPAATEPARANERAQEGRPEGETG